MKMFVLTLRGIGTASRKLFRRLDGRNGVTVLHARNAAAKQSCSLFNIPLRYFFLLSNRTQPMPDVHSKLLWMLNRPCSSYKADARLQGAILSTLPKIGSKFPGEYMIFNQATGNKIVVKDGLPEPL
jgi:hypothetical protein